MPYVKSPLHDDAEPPPIPSAAFDRRPEAFPQQQMAAPQPATHPHSGAFPHPAAYPPAAPFPSAYPPSIPAPSPTGIQVPLDDIEFRRPNRKPLVVIAILLVLIALGMTVLLILNYRGVIT